MTLEGGRVGSWVGTQQILRISTLEVQAEGLLGTDWDWQEE